MSAPSLVPTVISPSTSLPLRTDLSVLPLPSLGSTDPLPAVTSPSSVVEPEEEEPDFEDSQALVAQAPPSIPQSVGLHLVALVDIHDGYTFRQVWEFFKQALTTAPMFFRQDGIQIIRGNHDSSIVVNATLHSRKLLNYRVDPAYWNNPEQGAHVINVNLSEFHTHIKSVAKKESIRLFQYAEYPNYLHAQPYGGTRSSEGVIHIRTEPFGYVDYRIEDGIKPTDDPNFKAVLPSFCNGCNNIVRMKYTHFVLEVYPKGVQLYGSSETGSSSRGNSWGDLTLPPPSRFQIQGAAVPATYQTRCPMAAAKALNKMANFNQNGIVQGYSRCSGLIRLDVPIGCYGDMVCHLVDVKRLPVH